jgi:hypothetical protein
LRGILGAARDDCPRCRRISRREEALAALFREAREPDEDLWPGIEVRLDDKPGEAVRSSYGAPAWWTAAAATVLVAGIIGVLLSLRPTHELQHSTPRSPRTTSASVESSNGPDLVVLSAKIGGRPALFTVMSLGADQTMVFLQGD